MLSEESFSQEYGQIRPCIIPTDSVKIINLQLGPDENGIVVNYEALPEDISQKQSIISLVQDAEYAPITMRKYLLFMQSKAS